MSISYSKFIAVLCFLLYFTTHNAQNSFITLIEPRISFNVRTENRWAFNFSIANRDRIYARNKWNWKSKFLDISHFSSYALGLYNNVSLGMRYRERNLFDGGLQNEFRLTQQFANTQSFSAVKIAHRVRFEQRFLDFTMYRWRYLFSAQLPLSGLEVDDKEYFLITGTEILYSIGKLLKPKPGNRVHLSLGKNMGNDANLIVGLQYRYENYFTNPITKLFITSKLTIAL